MLRKLLVGFLFIISYSANATTTFKPEFYSTSCKINVRESGSSIRNYIEYTALVYYLDELNKCFFRDSAYIIVNFDNNYKNDKSSNSDVLKYSIDYLSRPIDIRCGKSSWKRPAVLLTVSTRTISHTDIFKLLYYALKKGGEEFYKDGINNVNKILALDMYPDFTEVLENVFYYSWVHTSYSKGNIDYYIQNDSFYLFKRSDPKEKLLSFYDWRLREEFLKPRNEEVLASFEHIEYAVSDEGNNMLVVDSDTSFFWYSLDDRSLKGPFPLPKYRVDLFEYLDVIDSFSVISGDILKLYTYTYTNKVELFFNTDTHEYSVDSANSEWYIKSVTKVAQEEEREAAYIKYKQEKAEKEKRKKNTRAFTLVLLTVVLYMPLFFAGYRQLHP